MANSATKICNLALLKLGQKRITDITEDSPTARKCNEIYEQVRDELEQAGPEKGWKFCQQLISISVSADEPAFRYDYQYQIPADYLRMVSVEAGGEIITDATRKGDFILTNLESSEIDLEYVKHVTDEAKFPPHFIKVFAIKIAIELAYNLLQSDKIAEKLEIRLETKDMPKAIGLDEQEKYVEEENTSWVDIGRTTTTIT